MRKIIHVDMDCFYAAIEMRDNPALRDVPLAVGGHPERRGVIATANYPARVFGVRSAMASARAMRLCPQLTILPPNITKYREASQTIREIFARFSQVIEPLSLDEAFLDVTGSEDFQGSATLIANEIRRLIFEQTGLTASAGVASNKFLAKVASDVNKPDGIQVVAPHEIDAFIAPLPVARIPGVGPVTQQRMKALGLHTCRDLQKRSLEQLAREFGNWAPRLYELCRGIDERPVRTEREAKSVSVENTYPHDLPDLGACIQALPPLLESLERRLRRNQHAAAIRGIFVKVKFDDFQQTTLERREIKEPTITNYARLLESAFDRGKRPVRLLGVGVRLESEDDEGPQQLELPLKR
ncbi:MAG: DNA polymerase IV [Bradymonadaceae bacterium]|nr:DNA polymerase IV [Lujinxingiaceae bacterium]